MTGYAFMVAVGDAIAAACDRLVQGDPDAFQYRGSDLRAAAERALFVSLVNNDSLRAAASGGPAAEVGSELEAAVAAELVPGVRPRFPAKASRARMLAAEAAGRLRAAPDPDLSAARTGGVWFLVDHAKFLRFIAPLVEQLGPVPSGVISLAPTATAELARNGSLPFVALDAGQGARPPVARSLGSAVRAAPDLSVGMDRFERVLRALEPDRVVVIEGNAPTDELLNRAADRLGIQSVCLQQGWSPIMHPGFRNMRYDVMAVWGEGFRELLAPHNPDQHFAVTGSHMLETPTGGSLREDLGGRAAAGFFLQGRSPLIEDEHLDAMTRLAGRVADALPQCTVVVREHPAAPLDVEARAELGRRTNVFWAPAERYALRDVLEAVAVTTSIYSTTLVESAALGTPPVVFGVTSMQGYSPDLAALGAGVETRDGDEAFETIARLLTYPGARADFEHGMSRVREEFFGGLDGRALERVAALVAGAAD